MRVRDLENWPPEPCGVFKTTFMSPSAEQAIIQRVLHVYDVWITFSREFEGSDHTYDFQTHDKITPPKLKVILWGGPLLHSSISRTSVPKGGDTEAHRSGGFGRSEA